MARRFRVYFCVPGHRRSVRLAGWDYSGPGAYLVTLVAARRRCIFGAVAGQEMTRSAVGERVAEEWARLAGSTVSLDAFVVMPNHLHGILWIDLLGGPVLGELVRRFKARSTHGIQALHGLAGEIVWQRGFHEHVIRGTVDLRRIRAYIASNPRNWAADPENWSPNPS